MTCCRRCWAQVPRFPEAAVISSRSWLLLQLSPIEPRCGSPAPGSPTSFTSGVRSEPVQDLLGLGATTPLKETRPRLSGEAVGDIRLDNPAPSPEGLVDDDLQGVVRRPLGPKPKRTRKHVRLEDR